VIKQTAPALVLLFLLLQGSCAAQREQPGREAGSAARTAAAATPEGKTLTDALGRRYAPTESPRRIVSLSPAVTEILFAVGAGDQVVGVTQYCDYPSEAGTRVFVGGFSGATVSVEQIRALEADLVILSADMHARIIALLDNLNIPSFAMEPRNFSQVYEVIAVVGEITGCEAAAGEVIAAMKAKTAAVGERVQGRSRPGVFWILSEEPLMTAGKETFVSEAIELGGGRNIFDDVREQWPLVSPEQIFIRKPDWILLGNDMREASSRLGSSILRNIQAVREGRVVFINADILYRYGPRLADGVELIADILHE
jgi:iron complex transport system substrate-binding protein